LRESSEVALERAAQYEERESMQVLIIDDQPAMRNALKILFAVHGITALVAGSPEEALELIRGEEVGVVIQDMNFREGETSGQGGIELFRRIKALDPDLPVLLMTAWTSLETAVELVQQGAADYFAKPWNDEKLLARVSGLLKMRELSYEVTRMRARGSRTRRALAQRFDLCGLVYASDAMHELVSLAVKVASSDLSVLITGPNGSGKELLAEIVRNNSRRANKPFVKVNAGGLPDQLLEAELFGAEAGAYTGAGKARVGRFEAANGGTLFLDELGNLSTSGQMKLLRVLQSGEFERLGSNTTHKTDVRVISATNADLPRAIAAGTFREDLYFRLNVIELRLPALADRSDDIMPLAEHILFDIARRSGPDATPCELSPGAIQGLLTHDWPGNVRELQNRLQRAALVCSAGRIHLDDLDLPRAHASSAPRGDVARAERVGSDTSSAQQDEAERAQIEEALARTGFVVAKAAAELGLSRQALYRRVERLGVSLDRRGRE
jgi:DNA-binding NtrC family response regulator